jgi:hypothetical protein
MSHITVHCSTFALCKLRTKSTIDANASQKMKARKWILRCPRRLGSLNLDELHEFRISRRSADEVIINGKAYPMEEARGIYKFLLAKGCKKDDVVDRALRVSQFSPVDEELDDDYSGSSYYLAIDNSPGWSEYDDWAGENVDQEASWIENSVDGDDELDTACVPAPQLEPRSTQDQLDEQGEDMDNDSE